MVCPNQAVVNNEFVDSQHSIINTQFADINASRQLDLQRGGIIVCYDRS